MKWQFVSEIVRSFVEREKPNHALVALALILGTPLALALISFLVLR